MKSSLEYSHRALEIAPEQIHFKFNIAFVQIQLAQLMYTLPNNERILEEVEAAEDGLEQAIESFSEIAQAKNPPYPRHDIEQRANMGRNTMRRQLNRAAQQQREYEDANKAKLAQAREVRDAELKRREEERRTAEEAVRAEKERLTKERQRLLEESRALAEKRAEEERKREEAEWTVDSEGEKVKRRRKGKGGGKRKKKDDASGTDGGGSDADAAPTSGRKKGRAKSSTVSGGDGSGEEKKAPTRKKRRLAKKPEKKMKSSELVIDSDSDGEGGVAVGTTQVANVNRDEDGGIGGTREADVEMADAGDEDEDDESAVRAGSRRQKASRMIDDDEDDEDEEDEGGVNGGRNGEAKGNVFADGEDLSMVDESVGAAGNADAVDTDRLDPDAF